MRPAIPIPTGFPWDEFREIAAELLSGKDGSVLQYGPTRGYRPLLESILGVLDARGITADLSEVMTTSGSQQGLDLTARVLIAPGDVVLVEVPTYTGAIAAFRNAQCRLVGVKQDADGINLEDLDSIVHARARRRRAGQPAVSRAELPESGGHSAQPREARAAARWAERRNILIIEDDPYGELYFEDVATAAETRPLKADDRDGRVIYLSTFSKTLAPGFRVAWVAAPAPIVERFDTAKQSMDLMCGILDQRVVHQSIVRGVLERQAAPLRKLYRQRRDVMEQTLREQFGDRLSWISRRAASSSGRTAGGLRVRGAAREGDGAGRHLRHRQRVLRRWQRPRPHSPVVLLAVTRAHSRGREAPGDGDATRDDGGRDHEDNLNHEGHEGHEQEILRVLRGLSRCHGRIRSLSKRRPGNSSENGTIGRFGEQHRGWRQAE